MVADSDTGSVYGGVLETGAQTSTQLLTLEAVENTCNATWCSTTQNQKLHLTDGLLDVQIDAEMLESAFEVASKSTRLSNECYI